MREKGGVGLGLVAMLAVGAGIYVQSTRPSSEVAPGVGLTATHRHKMNHSNLGKVAYVGGCTAYQPPLTKTEERLEKWDEERGHEPDELRADAYRVIETFVEQGLGQPVSSTGDDDKLLAQLIGEDERLRYVIALLPDPRHTHLALTFDRSIEAIESAAEDEGYTYDSSWLPWTTESKDYALRGDAAKEEERVDKREACPGILLFRKAVNPNSIPTKSGSKSSLSPDPYRRGLVVFVVGEQPTGGLKLSEWENTVRWIGAYTDLRISKSSAADAAEAKPLRILGPSYSGSLPSLEERLRAIQPDATSTLRTSGAMIVSGTATSCASVEWFKNNRPENPVTQFITFGENQTLSTDRLLHFLRKKHDAPAVAIVSEDETAYGDFHTSPGPPPVHNACEPGQDQANTLQLYYPRDISGLRNAYQEQELFSHPAGSPASSRVTVHTALSADLSAGSAEQGDTVLNFSKQSTMGEEAELYGIVSELRSRHIEDLLLRCSNPVDCLFLTRFFHHTYPDGRIIVGGADLLYRREVDTTEFRGTLALTDYSLITRSRDWTGKKDDRSLINHAFQSSDEEGVYLAARTLLTLPDSYSFAKSQASPQVGWRKGDQYLPDSDHAGWLRENLSGLGGRSSDTWLTVIGRDGYWPVAVLNDGTTANFSASSTIAKSSGNEEPEASDEMWGDMNHLQFPLAICTLSSFGLALFHLCGCVNRHLLRFVGLDDVFRPRETWWWNILFGITGAASLMPFWCLIVPWIRFYERYPGRPASAMLVIGLLLGGGIAVLEAFIYIGRWDQTTPQITFGRWLEVFSFTLLSTSMGSFYWWGLFADLTEADIVPMFYRSVHFTAGVSPLLPIWVLTLGFYLWCLHSLKGNGLLTDGRPILPPTESAEVPTGRGTASSLAAVRTRMSDKMAKVIEEAGRFLSYQQGQWLPPAILVGFWGLSVSIQRIPIRTFEGESFNRLLNVLILGALLLAVTDVTRLVMTWLQLKRMLYSLARSPLRRTFRAVRDISVRSLWDMSGNVPRSQYQFFWRQLEAVQTMLEKWRHSSPLQLKAMEQYGEAFRIRYLSNLTQSAQWCVPVSPRSPMYGPELCIRVVVSECTAWLFFHCLENSWTEELPERTKLNLEAVKPRENGEALELYLPLSESRLTCAAEEFVCLTYISYIQNTMARIRSLVFSMSTIFIAATLAIATYPISSKPAVTMDMLLFLLLLAIAVAVVYAGMERDTILSDITNTEQILSWEFYRKYLVFLVPPLLALLSAQFPELADSIFGWIQPDFAAAR